MKPESYWRPWLGDHCGVRAADIGELSLTQMIMCIDYVEAKTRV